MLTVPTRCGGTKGVSDTLGMPHGRGLDEGADPTQAGISGPVRRGCRRRKHALDRVGGRDCHLGSDRVLDDTREVQRVYVGNDAALRAYERVGFAIESTAWTVRLP